MMLKVDLHIHTDSDPKDFFKIGYSATDLIDRAAELKFDVISITNHDYLTYSPDLAKYAKEKGILLIPGIERTVQGKHVLMYNITQEEADNIKNFEDIARIRRADTFVIAAHPYFMFFGMKDKLVKHIELFDAVEFSFLWTNFMNFNKQAEKIAHKYNLPIIENSDAHSLSYFGDNYSTIDSEKDIISVFNAIKNNKVYLNKQGMGHLKFFWIIFVILTSPIRRLFYNLFHGVYRK